MNVDPSYSIPDWLPILFFVLAGIITLALIVNFILPNLRFRQESRNMTFIEKNKAKQAAYEMVWETRKAQLKRDTLIATIFDKIDTEVIEERAKEIRKLLEEK